MNETQARFQVQSLFQRYYHRDPPPEHMVYYVNALKTNTMTVAAIEAQILEKIRSYESQQTAPAAAQPLNTDFASIHGSSQKEEARTILDGILDNLGLKNMEPEEYEVFLNELANGSVTEADLTELIKIQYGCSDNSAPATKPKEEEPIDGSIMKRSGFIRSSDLGIEDPEPEINMLSDSSSSSSIVGFDDCGMGILPVGEGAQSIVPVRELTLSPSSNNKGLFDPFGKQSKQGDAFGECDPSLLLSDENVSIGVVSDIHTSCSKSASPPSQTVKTPVLIGQPTSPTRKVFSSSGTLLKSPFPPSPDSASVQVNQLFARYYPGQQPPADTVKGFVECVRSGRMTIGQVEEAIQQAIQKYNESQRMATESRSPQHPPQSPRPAGSTSSPGTGFVNSQPATKPPPIPPKPAKPLFTAPPAAAKPSGGKSKYSRVPAPLFKVPINKYPFIEESPERIPLSREVARAFLDQCQRLYCGDFQIPPMSREDRISHLVRGDLSRAEVAQQIKRSNEGLQRASQRKNEHTMLVSSLTDAVKLLTPSRLPTVNDVRELAKQIQDGLKTWEQALEELDN